MQNELLEELRKSFIEAIAAHKFVELKFGTDRSNEIKQIKQKWAIIQQNFILNSHLGFQANISSSKCENIESQLLKLQQELESTKIQLIEQQKITNNLIKQNSRALKEVKELINFINISSKL
ncbi:MULTISPECIES: hypothetical protein [unclassified Anabaena]|uniref:hypothetical protein n=1 Tax=unclassified Anabaena TaxID=2619674 RepID=UPI0039C6793A